MAFVYGKRIQKDLQAAVAPDQVVAAVVDADGALPGDLVCFQIFGIDLHLRNRTLLGVPIRIADCFGQSLQCADLLTGDLDPQVDG